MLLNDFSILKRLHAEHQLAGRTSEETFDELKVLCNTNTRGEILGGLRQSNHALKKR